MNTNPPKSKLTGRPKGTGTGPGKLLRVLLTPRQERLLTQVRVENGISESEFCRRALDDLFDKMEARGELMDSGPATVPAITKED